MKQAIIVQSMREKTFEQLVATRSKAIKVLRTAGHTVMNSAIADANSLSEMGSHINKPLHEVASLLVLMSMCSVVYFCTGWELELNCRMAHDAASAYGLEIIYEVDDSTKE